MTRNIIPITTTQQVVCQHCIWCRTTDDDGTFCANQPPCDDERETYFDRNPTSFCNNGLWVYKGTDNKLYTLSRPAAIINILNQEKS